TEEERDQLTIFAERIEPVSRKLSLEEGIEFMIILEKSGYNDCGGQNFIFAKDGIYFIDTEFGNFDPTDPKFGSIESIKNLLDPKDVEKFLSEYKNRKEAFDKEKELREARKNEYQEAFKNPYKNLSKALRKNQFTFQLNSLL